MSESFLRAMFDGSIEAMLVADDDGRYVDANPAACELFGVPRDQLIGRRVAEFAAPDHPFAGRWEQFLATGRRRGDFPLVRQDGRRRELEYSAVANVVPGLHLSILRDVTDRKDAERALHETELRLRTVISNAPVILFAVDRDGVYTEHEGKAVASLGLTPGEIRGQSVFQRQQGTPWADGIRRALEGERVLGEFASRGIIFACTMDPVRDERGEVTGVIGVGMDVTARKADEKSLRESQQLLEDAERVAHLGSWTSGPLPGKPIHWSPECARIFGREGEPPPTTEGFFGMTYPEDRARLIAEGERTTAAGLPCETEHRIVRPDGEVRWVYARVVVDGRVSFRGEGPIPGQSAGGSYRAMGVVQDITDRKRADEARGWLAALVESSDDAIISKDLRGSITSWNRGAERLHQWSASEMIGRPSSDLAPSDRKNDERRVLERVLRGETVEHEETRRMRKDGTEVEVAITASPIRDAAGLVVGVSTIARDLTERRRTEVRLRRSEEELRQAQKLEAIGSLAGGVAHDFNNLLTVILSYTDIIMSDPSLDEGLRADLEEVHAAGLRASDLTRQLLAFGRKQMLKPSVVDLSQVVRGVEKMLRRVLSETIDLSLLLSASGGQVHADPGQLEQVIMNLVLNARDAMPDGGRLTLETSSLRVADPAPAEHAGVAPGSYVTLSVTDTGMGMDRATQHRVFEPFFTTKDKSKGTGLGLSTVYGIIQQSGGHISVESEPGRGTTFRVYLPRTDRPVATEAPPPLPTTLGGGETILLVEDEGQVRAIMGTILRKAGYRVLEAQNAGEAYLLAEQTAGTIDLLLTDVVMPRMSGPQLAERLLSRRPGLEVLFVSGYTESTIIQHGVLDSSVEFLAKPILPDALLRKVRQVLDGGARRRSGPH